MYGCCFFAGATGIRDSQMLQIRMCHAQDSAAVSDFSDEDDTAQREEQLIRGEYQSLAYSIVRHHNVTALSLIVQNMLLRASRFAGKWIYDGCNWHPRDDRKTWARGTRLREFEQCGWRVEGPIDDDCAFLVPEDWEYDMNKLKGDGMHTISWQPIILTDHSVCHCVSSLMQERAYADTKIT